ATLGALLAESGGYPRRVQHLLAGLYTPLSAACWRTADGRKPVAWLEVNGLLSNVTEFHAAREWATVCLALHSWYRGTPSSTADGRHVDIMSDKEVRIAFSPAAITARATSQVSNSFNLHLCFC